jgi:hypothetical protein
MGRAEQIAACLGARQRDGIVGVNIGKNVTKPLDVMRRYAVGPVAFVIVAALSTASGEPTTSDYAIVQRISGPQSVSGWDYATIDGSARRLFLGTSFSSGAGVTALDLSSGRTTSNLVAVKTPHGIAIVGDGTAAVADASENVVLFFDEKTGKVVASVHTGKPPRRDDWRNPDSLLLEPKTGLLVAVNRDSGALSLVDVTQHAVVGTIRVGGKLEATAAKGDGTVYVNVESQNAIAVVDVPSRKLIRDLPLRNCEEASGLAYDSADGVVISVCGNGLAKFVDPQSGSEVASIEVGKGADAVIYDPQRKVVFIPGGDDGTLSVIHVADRRHIIRTQTLATQPGTRLGAIDPLTGKLYLPTAKPDLNAPRLHLPGLPPIPPALAGSFEFLVVATP